MATDESAATLEVAAFGLALLPLLVAFATGALLGAALLGLLPAVAPVLIGADASDLNVLTGRIRTALKRNTSAKAAVDIINQGGGIGIGALRGADRGGAEERRQGNQPSRPGRKFGTGRPQHSLWPPEPGVRLV
mgnify:CR=1 FL=1